MRTQYLASKVSCDVMLDWSLALIHLVEPAFCMISKQEPDYYQVFGAICRPPRFDRSKPIDMSRVLDWSFFWDSEPERGAAASAEKQGFQVWSSKRAKSVAPFYERLEIRARRPRQPSVESGGPDWNSESLSRALHGVDVWQELREGGPMQDVLKDSSADNDTEVAIEWFGSGRLDVIKDDSAADGDAQSFNLGFDRDLLSKLVLEVSPRIIIEVGVFQGQTTMEFARLLRSRTPSGFVIAVDTFFGDSYVWTTKRNTYHAKFLSHGGFPLLYYQFMSNVVENQLEQFVVPLPQTSSQAFRVLDMLGVRADLVYIDAGHDILDVLEDLEHYWLLLTCGGAMLGDDYHWPGVRAAVDMFAKSRELTVESYSHRKYVMRKRCPGVVGTPEDAQNETFARAS